MRLEVVLVTVQRAIAGQSCTINVNIHADGETGQRIIDPVLLSFAVVLTY